MSAAICTPLMSKQEYKTEYKLTFERLWDDELTNAEVSEATGIHSNTLAKYRKGMSQARLDILLKLRDFFAVRLQRPVSLDEFVKTIKYKEMDEDL